MRSVDCGVRATCSTSALKQGMPCFIPCVPSRLWNAASRMHMGVAINHPPSAAVGNSLGSLRLASGASLGVSLVIF